MFPCAWCKKENISAAIWTDFKEAICDNCECKYRFAKERTMFEGKVSDLSKERRREISSEFNRIARFIKVMRSIEKVQLTGKYKVLSIILAWMLAGLFLLPSFLFNWLEDNFNGVFVVYIIVCFIPFVIIFDRVKWLLKLFQLKREVSNYDISL